MKLNKSNLDVFENFRIRPVESRYSREDDIVASLRSTVDLGRECRLQPPPNSVARDRIADFLGDCEAEAGPRRPRLTGWPLSHFNQKRRCRCAPTSTHRQKLGTCLECRQNGNGSPPATGIFCRGSRKKAALGGKALAAFRTPTRQNPLASGRQHAFAKAMAALADKAAWLIGAFHGILSVQVVRPRRPLDKLANGLFFQELRKYTSDRAATRQMRASKEFGPL